MNTIGVCILCTWTYFTAQGISFSSDGSLDGKNISECHTNVHLHCKSDTTPVNIIFRINSTEVGTCVNILGRCYDTPPLPDRYTITHDFSSRLISLYINSTSEIDENNKFKCETDASILEITPIIKVFPQNETTHMTYQKDTSGTVTTFKIATGCMRHVGSVDFIWTKSKTITGDVLEPLSQNDYNKSVPDPVTDNTYCDSKMNCMGEGMSNTLDLNTDGSEQYYIHCKILVNDNFAKGNVIKISNTTFMLRDMSNLDNGGKSNLSAGDIFGITIGSLLVAALLL